MEYNKERESSLVLFVLCTVEPRFNEPLFNEVLDITNDFLCPSQSYSKMYGIELRYNEFFDLTNIIGSRDGAVVRALASHQCVPGSICGRHIWVEFVVGSLPCLAPRGFSPGTPIFPSPQKPTFPNSNSIWFIVKHFIVSLCLGWLRKHYLCLTLNLHLHLHNPESQM